jgi:hypothetical protein
MAENGEQKAQELNCDQIVLLRDRTTGRVTLTGNVQDIELGMDMLGRALRFLDVQYRIQAGIAAQAELKQRQEEFMRVQSLLGKH